MGKYKTGYCHNGHSMSEGNLAKNGSGRVICKQCVNARSLRWMTNRYRNDPEWREKMKRLSRDRYYRNRAPNGKASKCNTQPTST